MSKTKTTVQLVIESYHKLQETQSVFEAPFNAWSTFMESESKVHISGNQVCLGGDYKSVAEVRSAISWYALQFGGKVTWDVEREIKKLVEESELLNLYEE